MSPLHPPRDAFQGSVYSPLAPTSRTPYQARPELYSAYSIVDTAKDKAKQLSAEATAEFEKASSKAQPNGGKIELYSGRYYAACTFGGLLACVSPIQHLFTASPRHLTDSTPGPHPCCRHSP